MDLDLDVARIIEIQFRFLIISLGDNDKTSYVKRVADWQPSNCNNDAPIYYKPIYGE